MRTKFYKKITLLTLLIVLGGGGFYAWQNRWDFRDRIVARSYSVRAESEEVRQNIKLSSKGDLVFRASLTEVDGKDKFKQKCPVKRFEEASVLGCYARQKIYVLEVDEPKLKGVEEVTAGHELLHAQFERMSSGKKKRLFKLLDDLDAKLKDGDVRTLLASYKKELGSGEELYNEMFAIFGTQVEDVGPQLEQIYQEYFEDRTAIVEMYRNYSGEFKTLQKEIADYDAKLNSLKTEKESLEADITELGGELESKKAELDSLASSGSFEEYKTEAAAYNAQVEVYNQKVERIKGLVDEYNGIVEARNSLALSVQNLQDKLNANVSEKSEN